jgi:hypothetical protein
MFVNRSCAWIHIRPRLGVMSEVRVNCSLHLGLTETTPSPLIQRREFFLCVLCAFLWLKMGFVAEGFDGGVEAGAFGFAGGLAVGHDEIFEAGEFFVQAGVFDGGR